MRFPKCIDGDFRRCVFCDEFNCCYFGAGVRFYFDEWIVAKLADLLFKLLAARNTDRAKARDCTRRMTQGELRDTHAVALCDEIPERHVERALRGARWREQRPRFAPHAFDVCECFDFLRTQPLTDGTQFFYNNIRSLTVKRIRRCLAKARAALIFEPDENIAHFCSLRAADPKNVAWMQSVNDGGELHAILFLTSARVE